MKVSARCLGSPFLVATAFCLLAPAALASPETDPYVVWSGEATEPRPVLTTALGETLLVGRLWLDGHIHQTTGFPIDARGTTYRGSAAADLTARPSVMWTSLRALLPVILKVEVEADFSIEKSIPVPIEGDGYPGALRGSGIDPRRASLGISYGGVVGISAGLTPSHWGMGLIANDGTGGYSSANGSTVLTHGGDVVFRTALALGPLSDALNLKIAAAYDILWSDDTLLDGDSGHQYVAAVSIEPIADSKLGVYAVRRHVSSQGPPSGGVHTTKSTDVWVVDMTGFGTISLSDTWSLRVEAEVAVIFGQTELAPSRDYPVHDLLQLGAAAQLRLEGPTWGAILDFLYASGDQNFDDASQNAFKADTNYQLGFLFFNTVMAAISARAVANAADPEIVGYPSEDLHRLATRGAISNTLSIYPRAWWRPAHGLEVFAGALLAFSNVPMADPLKSRVSGGQAKNAFGAVPGDYQGTELNLGLRYAALIFGSHILFGLDAGVFIPGDALRGRGEGGLVDAVYGTRFSLGYQL